MTNITRTTCAVVMTLVLSVLPAVAQGTVTATVAVEAPIYLRPGSEVPLRVAAERRALLGEVRR
jgi:hypothetical protein